MKINPVKGTNDYLPGEAALRDLIMTKIRDVYKNNGFMRIMTPAIEDVENLDKSEGGDNLNLIFKIMKRGEKLEKALAEGDEKGLADLGLRYDLTLPLCRYYAANKEKLPTPAKCIQIDKVYRAERPQKGRLREFVQCDIDILGSESSDCEIELIYVTAKALNAVYLKDFKVRVNDRRVLKGILSSCGFSEDQLDSVCISFDKLDKIGEEGVVEELKAKGFDASAISKFEDMLGKRPLTLDKVSEILGANDALDNLRHIIEESKKLAGGAYEVEFDLSLVRGQGYYTGTVFEIESTAFNAAIAGGGRYDNLIGKFIGTKVPAVGFSIGFERIFAILSEAGKSYPDIRKKVAVLYSEGDIAAAESKAEEFRKEYDVAVFTAPKKTGKFLNRLTELGYSYFYILGQSEDLQELK